MSTATLERLSQLEQLKKFTKVVADTGDFESIREFKPQDSTTNPSLILAAVSKPEYAHLLDEVVIDSKKSPLSGPAKIESVMDNLLVAFGVEILKIVPGRVSTETDARLSFNKQGSIDKAHQLISLYEKKGISRERVLIKIASTWEGIKAAEELQRESINCNLTLLFSFPQAIACAEAKVRGGNFGVGWLRPADDQSEAAGRAEQIDRTSNPKAIRREGKTIDCRKSKFR